MIVILIIFSASAIYAANCGDGIGLCSCGDTLTASVVLGDSHPATTTQCNDTALTIGAHNIIIDGNGTTITSNGTGYGINNSGGFDNITIRNFAGINNFTHGVYSEGMENSTVYNNTIEAANVTFGFSVPYGTGVLLSANSLNCNVSSNTITTYGNDAHAIYVNESSNNVNIYSNTITTLGLNPNGIEIENSNNSNIQSNTVTSSKTSIYITGSNNIITRNDVNTTGYLGVFLYTGSTNNTISYNNITSTGEHALYLNAADDNTIYNNILDYSPGGVSIPVVRLRSGSDNNNISSNTITTTASGSSGIFAELNSNNNIFEYNVITTTDVSGYGFNLDDSHNNYINYNNITTSGEGGRGARLYNSTNNTIHLNRIITDDTTAHGLTLSWYSSNNNISSNYIFITGGDADGVQFWYYSNNNSFMNNNFTINKSKVVYIAASSSNNNQFNNDLLNAPYNTTIQILEGIVGTQFNNVIIDNGPNFTSHSLQSVQIDLNSTPPADPSGKRNLSDYLTITNTSAGGFIDFNLSYTDSDIASISEVTVRIYHYNESSGTWQVLASSSVDTTNNIVSSGNISTFSLFAPLGNEITICDGSYNGTGNWVINSTTTCSNETIYLNGNLTVQDAGDLTFNNITLIINATSDHQYYISTNPGSIFTIQSNSNITTSNTNFYYEFTTDGLLEIYDSDISYVWGNTSAPSYSPAGIGIKMNDSKVYRSTIENCKTIGVAVDGAKDVIIENNTIRNNGNIAALSMGVYVMNNANATIKGNNVTDHNIALGYSFGIALDTASATIEDNFVNNSGKTGAAASGGIYIDKATSAVTIRNNNISYTTSGNCIGLRNSRSVGTHTIENNNCSSFPNGNDGLSISNSTDVIIDDNVIESAHNSGIAIRNGCYNVNLTDNGISSSTAGYGMEIENSNLIYTYSNTISDSNRSGIYLSNCNNTFVYHNIIYNSQNGNGLLIRTIVNGTAINNTISHSSQAGINIEVNSENIKINDTTVYNTTDDSVRVSNSSGVTLNNLIINLSTANGFDLESNASANLTNSIIKQISGNDVDLNGATAYLINTTFNRLSTNVITAGSLLSVLWYLDTTIQNSTGSGLNASNVTIYNVSSVFVHSSLSNESGQISRQTLTDFTEDSTARTYHTPHNITATKLGYISNSTTINLTQTNSTFVTLILPTAPDNYPNVTLVSPTDNYTNSTSDPVNVFFECNSTDDNGLTNISLYITNSSNQSFSLNQTTNISGTSNSTSWILNLANGNYTWNCLAYDSAGQNDWGDANRTLKINYSAPVAEEEETTTTTTSSSGGGGTGTNQVVGQFSKKIWNPLTKGKTTLLEVDNGVIGITEVEFSTNKDLWGVWMKVEKKDSLPSNVKRFSKKVYKYAEITKGIAFKDEYIKSSKIKFKVLKSWLTENGLSKEKIALFRYNNDKWNELTTTISNEDSDYVYYSAETPGFSYFLIGESKKVVKTEAKIVEEKEKEELEEVEYIPIKAEEVIKDIKEYIKEVKEKSIWPAIVLIAGVLAFILVSWLIYRKKGPKKS
ncbi:MAG: right-handed parallel beta-helix repeat-containing protein [Nanoarchaeota archaeon]|nr:right-handed parallel beta-helix repeat-containing protein [Nanoarchaeota archaeon]MBU1632006.1 right-handed parallel beta-helix repeat-containing protein [Nanoarchaeota archaeon]MBU1875621.1 right-handed parallel beta-helix repeat-containing protein [Nanoarchaeota archaeon]